MSWWGVGSLDFSADAGIIISRYRGKGGRERWREGAMEGGSNGRMKAEREREWVQRELWEDWKIWSMQWDKIPLYSGIRCRDAILNCCITVWGFATTTPTPFSPTLLYSPPPCALPGLTPISALPHPRQLHSFWLHNSHLINPLVLHLHFFSPLWVLSNHLLINSLSPAPPVVTY